MVRTTASGHPGSSAPVRRRDHHRWLPTGLDRPDGLILIGLVLVVGLYAVRYFDAWKYPFEDAAILMRYAQHLAQGAGIVWNIGEKPVDGATDFLFMVVLAGLARAGLSLELAVRLVGVLSHLLTVLLVYVAIRQLHGSNRWIALLSAAYLGIGPGLGYIAAFFGTPFFALFAATTWYLANRLVKQADDPAFSIGFAISGLVMGLIRPEGVLLAGFMLLSITSMNGLKASRRTLLCFVATFAVLGGLYFLWRWHYFGYPLPNPFYKKSGGAVHLLSLMNAVRYAFLLCLPFLPAFVLALRSQQTVRQAIFVLIPVAGFVGIWVLLSDEVNYLARYQYAILPIVLMSWPQLVNGIWQDWQLPKLGDVDRRQRLTAVLVVELLFLGVLGYQYSSSGNAAYLRDGRYDVAVMLRQYHDRGYTLATSEVGHLALYSGWRVVDAWGLNDQWIAHHGGVTEAYLDEFRPHVIMFHAYFSPIVPPEAPGVSEVYAEWTAMVLTLKVYAEKNGYLLAAAYGYSPYDTHYYYVRPDFPESAEIAGRIRSMEYYWYQTGSRSLNYALLQRAPDR